MKLFLLEPIESVAAELYDFYEPSCVYGFVVRATNEEIARAMANTRACDSLLACDGMWNDKKASTCTEIDLNGKPGIIIAAEGTG